MKLRNVLALGLGGAALAALLSEPSLAQSPAPEAISPPPSTRPVLTVVVDTEEEFDWSQPCDRRNVGENHLPACVAAEQSADRLW